MNPVSEIKFWSLDDATSLGGCSDVRRQLRNPVERRLRSLSRYRGILLGIAQVEKGRCERMRSWSVWAESTPDRAYYLKENFALMHSERSTSLSIAIGRRNRNHQICRGTSLNRAQQAQPSPAHLTFHSSHFGISLPSSFPYNISP
jgi:hypothetical protein